MVVRSAARRRCSWCCCPAAAQGSAFATTPGKMKSSPPHHGHTLCLLGLLSMSHGLAAGIAPPPPPSPAPAAAVGEVLSVKAFGAKGDGVADDAVPFQLAIDAAQRHYRSLFVPAGVYRLDTGLIVNRTTHAPGDDEDYKVRPSCPAAPVRPPSRRLLQT